MSSEMAVRLEGVSKAYESSGGRSFRGGWKCGAAPVERTVALQELDLLVPKGQVLGITGQNGAGKSTLLKVIAGVVAPTSGSVTVQGRGGGSISRTARSRGPSSCFRSGDPSPWSR